jgi:diguanylate cyclase (GGDEF)-like protein
MMNIEKRDGIHTRILQAVNNSSSDEELCETIAHMVVTEGDDVYSPLLSALTSVELDPDLSKEIWERAIKHRESLSNSLGRPVGVVVALHDLLANIERQITRPKIIELDIYSKIVQSMVTDGLTGLYNSVSFQAELEREIERCNRYGSFASLIIFSIDNFKKFNDTYGRQSGDMALKEFASVMKEKSRKVDLLARYDEETFACLLPMTNTNKALMVAERIREAIEKRDIPLGRGSSHFGRITCSGGIAALGSEILDSADQLIDRANRALYRAKAEGKNHIFVDFFEKREVVRLDFPLLLSYRKTDETTDEKHDVKMINFGGCGVLLQCTEKLALSSMIDIEFSLSDISDEKFIVSGKVVRIEEKESGQIDVAVQFVEINQEDRTKIYRILYKQKKTTVD